MMRELRAELSAVLEAYHPARRPSVRRSDENGWLLATDMPQLIPVDVCAELMQRLCQSGWRTTLRSGWLLLDHDLRGPLPCCAPVLSGEAACVVSLLHRHPGGGADDELLRRIARTSEQGEKKLQQLCGALHHEFSAMLRQGRSLPAELLPYLLYAFSVQGGQP